MRIGLRHISICCPNSRCCYRVRSKVLKRMAVNSRPPPGPVTFCSFRHQFLLLPPAALCEEFWQRTNCPSCCDVGQPVAYVDERRKRTASPWGHLLAGALAGAVSRTATAPLETLRIMSMTRAWPAGAAGSGGLAACASSLVREQGWGALYRGNFANVVRSAPQKALDFFGFDVFKSALSKPVSVAAGSPPPAAASTASICVRTRPGKQRRPSSAPRANAPPLSEPGAAATLAAAGLAGALSNVVLYPLEVVRTRLSTDTVGQYRGVIHTFNLIWRTEGVPALYRWELLS
jgi:solute carrier family 25 (mitochondrial phosphate transporter), member 23/24/25/41